MTRTKLSRYCRPNGLWFLKYLLSGHFQRKSLSILALHQGFPGGSEVKASACSAGDPGSIPWSGRSPGEGNGNPLQYSWETSAAEGKGVTGDNEKAPLAAAENTSSLMFRGYLSLGGGGGESGALESFHLLVNREKESRWGIKLGCSLLNHSSSWGKESDSLHTPIHTPPHTHTYLHFINMHKWSRASCHGKQEDMTCPPNGS